MSRKSSTQKIHDEWMRKIAEKRGNRNRLSLGTRGYTLHDFNELLTFIKSEIRIPKS